MGMFTSLPYEDMAVPCVGGFGGGPWLAFLKHTYTYNIVCVCVCVCVCTIQIMILGILDVVGYTTVYG